MKYTKVLDTSVLVCEENSILQFDNTEVLIPIIVWEELNVLKEDLRKGYVPRKVLRLLKELSDIRSLKKGVNLKELKEDYPDTIVKIVYEENKDVLSLFSKDLNDYHIIAAAYEHNATLVSMDIGLLAIANDLVKTEEFLYDIKSKKEYKGYKEVFVNVDYINKIYKRGFIDDDWNLNPNEFIILIDELNERTKAIGIKKQDRIILCDLDKNGYGMQTKPLNLEQKMLLYLLNDDDIKAITVTGVSGRGKSLLTIDYALSQVKENKYYNLLYTKSITPVDDNEYLGFYKGGVDEKLEPHLQPLFSSIEFLYKDSLYGKSKSREERLTTQQIYENLKDNGDLSVIPLSDIRGMNIDNKIVMLDEAQNTHRHMIKALVSRLTDNSKIIIAGDIEQIDNNRLSMFNNGLSHMIEQGKEEECIAHITLDLDKSGSKRGKLATFASERL